MDIPPFAENEQQKKRHLCDKDDALCVCVIWLCKGTNYLLLEQYSISKSPFIHIRIGINSF